MKTVTKRIERLERKAADARDLARRLSGQTAAGLVAKRERAAAEARRYERLLTDNLALTWALEGLD